jgi:hypothetical protein
MYHGLAVGVRDAGVNVRAHARVHACACLRVRARECMSLRAGGGARLGLRASLEYAPMNMECMLVRIPCTNTMYEYHVGAEMRANVHARMRTTMNTNAPHQHASMCIRRRLRMCALACAGAGRDVECATCRNVQRVMCHTQYAVCVVRCASCMRHAASNDQGVASRAPHSGIALMLRQLRARAPRCVLRARRAARIDAQTCAYGRRYCISAKCILHVRVPSAPLHVKMCGCVYLSM